MAKNILILIIGILLGLGLSVIIQSYKPPPGHRGPRPNVRRSKIKQYGLPIGIGAVAVLTAWLLFSVLKPDNAPQPQVVKNTLTQKVPDSGVSEEILDNPGMEAGETGPDNGRELLVVNTPLARSAMSASPVASSLEQFGVGHRLVGTVGRPAAPARSETQAGPAPAVVEQTETARLPAEIPKTRSVAAPPEKPKPKEPVDAGLKFTVHLSSFTVKGNADRSLTKLKAAGVPAFVSTIEIKGVLYYRLMAGRFTTTAEAEAYGRQLEKRGLTEDTGRFLIKPLIVGPGQE